MIEYSWQVVDLPVGEEPPRFQLLSYVVFSNDLNAINGNRKNYNSPIMFHKLGMPNGLIDSLNRVSSVFTNDTTFIESDSPRMYDGPSYAFLIFKKESAHLIGFVPYSLPQNLNYIFEISRDDAHSQQNAINLSLDTTELRTKFEKAIRERSRLPVPPIVKTLRFVTPKPSAQIR